MKKLTSDLINIPGFEKLQPSDATSDVQVLSGRWLISCCLKSRLILYMHIYELCMGFYSTSGTFDLYGWYNWWYTNYFRYVLTSHIYRVGATVSIRHDFQPPGLLIQTSQRRVIQTPLMMCFLVHSHLESTQNGMQTGRPAVHRSRNIIIGRESTQRRKESWSCYVSSYGSSSLEVKQAQILMQSVKLQRYYRILHTNVELCFSTPL